MSRPLPWCRPARDLTVAGLVATLLGCGDAPPDAEPPIPEILDKVEESASESVSGASPTLDGDTPPAETTQETPPQRPGMIPGGRAASGNRAPKPGNWHAARRAPRTPEELEELQRLEALGYAQGVSEAQGFAGVTRHDPERTFDGPSFYVSGHGPEARLIDMKGRVLHRWRRAYGETWPDFAERRQSKWRAAQSWRRAFLLEGGDVLAIFEGIGLLRVDAQSNLRWATRDGAHHDLELRDDGTLFVLTRKPRKIPELHAESAIFEDFVSVRDLESGEELRRVSLLACFEQSDYAELWKERAPQLHGDIFHTNALRVLDGSLAERIPAFQAGRVLLSFRTLDMIAVADLDDETIVWVHHDSFRGQHDPRILPNGHLLLFDNGAPTASRVLEIDPTDGSLVWEFPGTTGQTFFSQFSGAARRLPNGNTLAVESNAGRAVEVATDGDIVWEYYNPHTAGEQNEFIATLFDLTRLSPDTPIAWARAPEDEAAVDEMAPNEPRIEDGRD